MSLAITECLLEQFGTPPFGQTLTYGTGIQLSSSMKYRGFSWSELVLRKVAKEWPVLDIFENAIPFFHVVPSCDAPIMIQNPRSEKARGYWDHPVNRTKPGEAELLFIGYFDWNRLDYADLR